MDIPEHRKWMYNRLQPGKKGYTDEFLFGVEDFVTFACQQEICVREGVIRCPCLKCKNRKYLNPEEVRMHLYLKGFQPGYWCWYCHGEEMNRQYVDDNVEGYTNEDNSGEVNQFRNMIFDVVGPNVGNDGNNNIEEPPNNDTQKFYDMLNAAQRPLWTGCEEHTELSVALRMLSIKSDYHMSQGCFDETMKLLQETNPDGNLVPSNLYETKKLVTKLGLGHRKIDCCPNGCMLYYKDDEDERHCKFCGAPRYKELRMGRPRRKEVPLKRMYFLPLIPRLQRLYSSMRSAEHMRWHHENRREEGVLCHPSDGESWKHFDRMYPDFALEPRNVRLGLCSDGFSPYNQSSAPYSCWPVIVTPYNLPPEMCMTAPYMFLTLIIPGPHNPKSRIDVYLQPLIDELKTLWNDGVLTYDVSKK